MAFYGGSSTTTTIVQQVVSQQCNSLHLVLQPQQQSGLPPQLQQNWNDMQEVVNQQVHHTFNQEFIQQLCAHFESKHLAEDDSRDALILIILKKMRTILEQIISGYPLEVQQRAIQVFNRLEAAGKGVPSGHRSSEGSHGSGNGASSAAFAPAIAPGTQIGVGPVSGPTPEAVPGRGQASESPRAPGSGSMFQRWWPWK